MLCACVYVYKITINCTMLSTLCIGCIKIMLLQYFDDMKQSSGLAENKGAKLIEVMPEFKHCYITKKSNIVYKHIKNQKEELIARRFYLLTVSRLFATLSYASGKKKRKKWH